MKILVLGGSSFSGRAFIALARSQSHEVAELSRPEHDINGTLPVKAAEMVRDGFENVINFIALNVVAASWDHAPDYYRTNVAGVARLASSLDGLPLRRFVQVSTPEVYGTTRTFLKEDAGYRPSTPYALSRSTADIHLALLHRERGFPVSFTRTVNVYGPGQQPYRIVPKAAICALTGKKLPLEGGGVSTRSFIHVRDMAEAYLAVLARGRAGAIYHIATPRQTSIRDLVELICGRLGVPLSQVVEDAPERVGKDMAYQLDDSRIRAELGWRDKVNLVDGLDETVGWVKANLASLSAGTTAYEHRA